MMINMSRFGSEKLEKSEEFINRKLVNKNNSQFQRERTEKIIGRKLPKMYNKNGRKDTIFSKLCQ